MERIHSANTCESHVQDVAVFKTPLTVFALHGFFHHRSHIRGGRFGRVERAFSTHVQPAYGTRVRTALLYQFQYSLRCHGYGVFIRIAKGHSGESEPFFEFRRLDAAFFGDRKSTRLNSSHT